MFSLIFYEANFKLFGWSLPTPTSGISFHNFCWLSSFQTRSFQICVEIITMLPMIVKWTRQPCSANYLLTIATYSWKICTGCLGSTQELLFGKIMFCEEISLLSHVGRCPVKHKASKFVCLLWICAAFYCQLSSCLVSSVRFWIFTSNISLLK